MKRKTSIFYSLLSAGIFFSCQSQADLQLPQANCTEKFKSTSSIASALKNLATGYITQDIIAEAYISATNAEGNFKKSIYLQDLPQKANLGLKVNVDDDDLHNDYPLGSKISLKLQGLYLRNNAGVYTLSKGLSQDDELIPIEGSQFNKITARACYNDKPMVSGLEPRPFDKLSELKNDLFVGQLVQLNNIKVLGSNVNSANAVVSIYPVMERPSNKITVWLDNQSLLREKMSRRLNDNANNNNIIHIAGILVKIDGQYMIKPRYLSDYIEVKP